MKEKLWNKDFIIFLISLVQASFGASLSAIALSFLVLKLTGSPSAMAITLALKFLPAIFTPFIIVAENIQGKINQSLRFANHSLKEVSCRSSRTNKRWPSPSK